MKIPSILEMLEAGVHFGHQSSRWHPRMRPYIFTQRNGVHIIDLEKTQTELEKTLAAVKKMAAEGKQILFITTKPQARDIVRDAAIDCGMPYLVERWIGGFITNFDEIKKLLNKYISLKEQLETGGLEKYTKKERLEISKEIEKMGVSLAGLVSLKSIPDALFVPAMQREKTAVTEANRLNVPIVAVCDTNANPDKADYIIPANDDAIKSITMMVNLVSTAAKEGREEWEKKQIAEKGNVKDVKKGEKKSS
ncbi:MAG: 30S ribosomal protein S2 [Candidatus Magasanikbacteria bacterium]